MITAFEINHFLKKTGGKKVKFSLKIYMSNAYDRVEWCFIRAVMGRLGLHENFIDVVLHYVSTSSFSILINGELFGFFRPHRGLR